MSNVDEYLQWITPKLGDPTYSILKAHLLFEELLHSHLQQVLPYANALKGARLSFVQLLAVAKASCADISPDHWIWKAIGDLNKLRNMLAHEAQPKDFFERINKYTEFITEKAKCTLPEPEFSIGESEVPPIGMRLYSACDLATIVLYYQVRDVLKLK